jgi:hypothetical protein
MQREHLAANHESATKNRNIHNKEPLANCNTRKMNNSQYPKKELLEVTLFPNKTTNVSVSCF